MTKYLLKIDLDKALSDATGTPGLEEYKEIMSAFFDGELKAGMVAKKMNHTREMFEASICALVIIAIRDGDCNRVAES